MLHEKSQSYGTAAASGPSGNDQDREPCWRVNLKTEDDADTSWCVRLQGVDVDLRSTIETLSSLSILTFWFPVVDLEPKKKLQSAAFTFFSNVPESSSWLTLKMETVALMWRSLRTLKSSPCFWSPMNSRPDITSTGYVGRFSSSWNHPEIYSVVVVCFPLDLQIHLFTSY